MRLFLSILLFISLTSCADVMLLGSSYGVVGSSNTYVKAYNTADVISITTTKKDIKQHAYNKIKKKPVDKPINHSYELQLIAEQLKELNRLHQEVNLKLDQLTIQVELNQEDVDTRLIDLETNKLVAFYKTKYANLIAMHQKSKSYKSPRQLAVVLQNQLKRQKEFD
jgi:Na+-transporting NADH:ubiquinone oxidoreductase subunit NqrC